MPSSKQNQTNNYLQVRGAKQNNLKNFDLDIPLNEMTVVTGVSGSGKSSLAFDTIYAEGQRRYVETFSPYARQFLDRMDRPRVESIQGVPPAVAINQVNPVRTTRSTVGTMTEINDHLKLLFARVASLYCSSCGSQIKRYTNDDIFEQIVSKFKSSESKDNMVQILFPISVPESLSTEYASEYLQRQGYKRIASREGDTVYVVQDRIQPTSQNRSRMIEAIEVSLNRGNGFCLVQQLDEHRQGVGIRQEFTDKLRCSDCNVDYSDPLPNLFSFNSPIGACEMCRGFGRVIGIDYGQVIPNESLTLREGVIRAFNSPVYSESYRDILNYGEKSQIPLDTPWNQLSSEHKHWVIQGEGGWYSKKWYGVQRFFNWLEQRKHKMHVRVFLSYYRAYSECPDCSGARLKPESLNWRLGSNLENLPNLNKFRYPTMSMLDSEFESMAGLTLHDIASLPLSACEKFFRELKFPPPYDEATEILLAEVRARLGYLTDVGLGYLNLDRQSRTLSGGEVQRINLTTALGTTLVNTLFVLDEPTIGLHSRDISKVIRILHRLRTAGNTLLVVEHEEQMIRAADCILDLGPGPGERGGNIVHFGTIQELLGSKESVTAACLRNGDYLPEYPAASNIAATNHLQVRGAQQNNLKHIDVSIPLNRMICITGVSGSGKSTLVDEVLYRGACREMGKTTLTPGKYSGIHGLEQISDIVMVSQSQIGKTTRSNPVSYVGALTPIRERFAKVPLAIHRGYTAGYFSFNTDLGRCSSCGGSGFERIEMQFLSDVYLRCTDCDGTRFQSEICDVKIRPNSNPNSKAEWQPQSIVGILDMTVSEAVDFFFDAAPIVSALTPLIDVGLEYLKLGQPVPTLSGGEAQRLKLAAHVAKSENRRSRVGEQILFLFDEPTTGLHFTDVSKLIDSLRKLIDNGHSVVVIEHNLDLVSCSDWIIDLGPEGGEFGGVVIAEGTPKDLARKANSPTGEVLKDYYSNRVNGRPSVSLLPEKPNSTNREIYVRNAREHNLKNICLSIPYNAITVITGMSGSGKSTVAFDILFAEGQKRYLETLNAYARQFMQPASKADFDAVTGLPPTIAIEQRTSRGGRRSTVATLTEIYHYIRLLFVRFGVQYCPDCGVEVDSQSIESVVQQIRKKYKNQTISIFAPLIVARKGYYTDIAKSANKRGVEFLLVDGELQSTAKWPRLERHREHDIDMPIRTLDLTQSNLQEIRSVVEDSLHVGRGHIRIVSSTLSVSERIENLDSFSTSRSCSRCRRSFGELDPRLFSYNSHHGWCGACVGTGLTLAGDDSGDDFVDVDANSYLICKACDGKRLKPEALAVKFKGMTIDHLAGLSIRDARNTLSKLRFSEREKLATKDIFSELNSRLEFLDSVGLSYLSLSRSAPTLSGGEAQRIRLASQLGSSLCGACYVLDEPTIGLHTCDNRRLLLALKALRDKGNTIVIVEHDEETIISADNIIDLGPGGGIRGGSVVACGTLAEIKNNPNSVTGKMLKSPLQHPMPRNRPAPNQKCALQIVGAERHNLRKINVSVPLQSLVCVTGVSGSGKSTLVREVLYLNLFNALARNRKSEGAITWDGCKEIIGWQQFGRVLEVDQTPIGKTPRSCPATYVNIWQTIRKLFAETSEARLRGYDASRFSFNVDQGRCAECKGQGEKKIEMNFLPDVRVKCDHCNGERYNRETLSVRYREKSIADVLSMSMEEAGDFFQSLTSLKRVFRLLVDVGLGYLTLGQPSPTLSGGEAQRIKLVSELSKSLPRSPEVKFSGLSGDSSFKTLYVLDEPTVGLHAADVEKLIRVIHALVDTGNTVVIIEHNLDVIAEADWVIDLGLEGGNFGGKVVTQGKLSRVMKSKQSHTANALREFIDNRIESSGCDQ